MAVDQNIAPEGNTDRDNRGGIIGWLYRRYQQYDTWSGRWDWLNWLIEMFKTHTATSVAVTGSTAAATVAGVLVVTDPDLRDRWLPFLASESKQTVPAETTAAAPVEPQPVAAAEAPPSAPPSPPAEERKAELTVPTERWGSSVIFPIEGKDSAGRQAAFDIAVLPSDLAWARKSSSELTHEGKTLAEADVPGQIFTAELRAGLARSKGFMAVGLASQEGRRDEETTRAQRRAVTAAGWLAAIAEPQARIWTLNLGQYKGRCKAAEKNAETAWQRPVMVVGVRPQSDDVKLDEAFADAISGKTNLPSRDCYTSFDLRRHR